MDKETAGIALVLVAFLGVFAAVQPFLPANSQPFSEIGVLGPSQTVGEYPTSVVAGHSFTLYGYIGNHERVSSYYRFLVKVGNQTTQINNSTFARAPVIFTYSHVLDDNQSTTFPMTLSLSNQGANVKLIFELWSYDVPNSTYVYTGLWDQLWLNVTGH